MPSAHPSSRSVRSELDRICVIPAHKDARGQRCLQAQAQRARELVQLGSNPNSDGSRKYRRADLACTLQRGFAPLRNARKDLV